MVCPLKLSTPWGITRLLLVEQAGALVTTDLAGQGGQVQLLAAVSQSHQQAEQAAAGTTLALRVATLALEMREAHLVGQAVAATGPLALVVALAAAAGETALRVVLAICGPQTQPTMAAVVAVATPMLVGNPVALVAAVKAARDSTLRTQQMGLMDWAAALAATLATEELTTADLVLSSLVTPEVPSGLLVEISAHQVVGYFTPLPLAELSLTRNN